VLKFLTKTLKYRISSNKRPDAYETLFEIWMGTY